MPSVNLFVLDLQQLQKKHYGNLVISKAFPSYDRNKEGVVTKGYLRCLRRHHREYTENMLFGWTQVHELAAADFWNG